MSQEISHNKTKDKIYKLACSSCDTETNHLVLASIEDAWSDDEACMNGFDVFEIIGCRGCNRISFRLSSTNSDDFDYNHKGELVYHENEILYPQRLAGRKEIEETYSLPESVRKIYRETHSAMCGGINILAGVGIRLLIEAVCAAENSAGSFLKDKIDNLAAKGVLTRKDADILHHTRILGNRSAHEFKTPSGDELDVAMDIAENLLRTVYIIPKKAERLKNSKVKKIDF